jgi:hypothetical protein
VTPLARVTAAALGLALAGCSGEDDADPGFSWVAATFNTGTSEGMGHDAPPDDGYGSAEAKLSDLYYGDGLAWAEVIADTRSWFADNGVDVVGFQEIFHSEECAALPAEAKPGFVCETWKAGDPTVAQLIVGEGWQVGCHKGHADKCLAVRKSFGTLQGCSEDLCLDALAGSDVTGCGKGSRIGRAVIELAKGGTLTVVNVHGSSGIAQSDQDCRVKQFEQVFVDLGDGAPAASGERNVILGDFNTDPGRMADFDESAALVNQHAGAGKSFRFVTQVGAEAPPTYAGLFNIDHVLSDAFGGACWVAGVSDGHPKVSETVYFDHKPHVCRLKAH